MSNFNSPQPSTLINSSMILKGVLSIPSTSSSISNSSNRSISPDFTTTSKIESQSPTNVGKKNSSPDSKSSRLTNNSNNNSSKKAKKRPSHAPLSSSSTSLPTSTVTNPSNYFFAGSDFMNSPDPLTIPIPNFDDVDDFFSNNLSTQFGSLNFTPTTISSSSSNSSDSITSSSSFNNSSCSSLEDKTSALRRILQVK